MVKEKNIKIIGDTHGVANLAKKIISSELKNCFLIHVGDLGVGFLEYNKDIENLVNLDEILDINNIDLYVIRGNHDFKKFWYPELEKEFQLPDFERIFFQKDNTIVEMGGKGVFFSGGAISIDRTLRKNDIPCSWDQKEGFILDRESVLSLLNTYNSMKYNVDIVITHSAPYFAKPIGNNVNIVNQWHNHEKDLDINSDLKAELTHERVEITHLYNLISKNNNISHWFYGHFHNSYETEYNNTVFVGLNISEIIEVE